MGGRYSKAVLHEHINTLLTTDVSEENCEFLKAICQAELSEEDVTELVTAENIRKLRVDKPDNMRLFVIQIIYTLRELIDTGTYGKQFTSNNSASALTCIRLLTKIIPQILENPEDEFYIQMMWQQWIEGDTSNDPNDDNVTTIGYEVLVCLMRVLFLKGFTVNAPNVTVSKDESMPKHKVDTRFIWCGGVGTAAELPVSTPKSFYSHRCEVLRCLLVCLSQPLYQTIDQYQQTVPTWLRVMTSGELPYTANLFCSLMSSIFAYDPIGYGVPYGSMFSNADREEMSNCSVQIMAILLDFNPSVFVAHEELGNGQSAAHTDNNDTETENDNAEIANGKNDSNGEMRNVFRTMLSGIRKESEIDVIFDGFVCILRTCPNSRNTYLPHSSSMAEFNQELLILFWHLITTNTSFLRRMAARRNSNNLVVPILFLLLDASNGRVDAVTGSSKVGLLHMCSFILLVMSSEREFAVRLNEAFNERFPLEICMFQGTYADLLVLVIHKVIVESTSSTVNDSLIDMLLTVMCNISAYIKSFCMEACVKLLNLLERFSRPAWLFKAPYHYHDVFFLLDMLNNLIQYQYEGNVRLVYSILRQKNIFLDLQNREVPEKYLNAQAHTNTLTHTSDDPEKNDYSTATNTPDNKSNRSDKQSNTNTNVKGESGGEVDQWLPTEEWFNEWKPKLPLQTVTRLIQCLLPQVESECTDKGWITQEDIIDYLQRKTMVGLLPVPHPIIIRNYQPNAYTSLWFTSYMWGVVFSRNQKYAICDWRKVKFVVINNR